MMRPLLATISGPLCIASLPCVHTSPLLRAAAIAAVRLLLKKKKVSMNGRPAAVVTLEMLTYISGTG